MTKQEFLDGKSFRPYKAVRKGESSFKFISTGFEVEEGYLVKEIRSEKTGDIVIESYEASVVKITDNTFNVAESVVGKPVRIRYRFDQLVEVE